MQLPQEEYKLPRKIQQNEKHKRNYVKITVLLMLHLDCSPALISDSSGISLQALHNYVEKYQQVGLDGYLSDS